MTVGWYVHHHGAGHRQRFLAAAGHLGAGVTALSSLPRPAGYEGPWRRLPLDLPDAGLGDPTAGGTLHWAPPGCDGLRERMASIAAWIAEERPAVLVVDVSVEVALLGRLLGVPVVLVAQRGVRTDPAHQRAYAAAARIVAPWTAASHLATDGVPMGRLTFCGAISRFDGRTAVAPSSDDVLLLVGSGGHALTAGQVGAAADATGRTWHVAGALRAPDHPRVVDHGDEADVWALLERCSVVVGTAGGNVVGEVAAARRPFVCLPQERPFREQERQAEALSRLGVAEVARRLPSAEALARAQRRDVSRWAALHDGAGAERLARAVTEAALACA